MHFVAMGQNRRTGQCREHQQQQAASFIAELNQAQVFAQPIVTELSAASTFYPAEAYHQGYYRQNPNQGYCHWIITPKMQKFREIFQQRLK